MSDVSLHHEVTEADSILGASIGQTDSSIR